MSAFIHSHPVRTAQWRNSGCLVLVFDPCSTDIFIKSWEFAAGHAGPPGPLLHLEQQSIIAGHNVK